MIDVHDLQTDGKQRWHNLLQEAEEHRRSKYLQYSSPRFAQHVAHWVRNHIKHTKPQPQLARE